MATTVGQADSSGRNQAGVMTPGITQMGVLQGGPQFTDGNGNIYASQVHQLVDVNGVNKAVIDTNGNVAVKIGNSTVPAIVQKISNVSTGSVASLAQTFASNNTLNNSIIVVCGVGNVTAPTVADSAGNTYTRAVLSASGSAFETAIFYAVNIKAGANTVTVTNAGATASMAMEIYEVSGLIGQVTGAVDQTSLNSGNAAYGTSPAVTPAYTNELFFAGIGLGTAAQTITVGSGWTNDSGQQNPTTPAGLYSFVSMSQFLASLKSVQPSGTWTSEPYAIAAAAFRPVMLGVEGTVALSPTNTGLPVNVPTIVQKVGVAGSAAATTLTAAFLNNVTAGNSIIVVCGAGNNGSLTVTDTLNNTYTQAVLQAQSTTFEAAIFYATNSIAGSNTVTLTLTSGFAAMEIYEVAGLIAQSPSVLDNIGQNNNAGSGTATTTAIGIDGPNEYVFAGVGIGTAVQTITAGTGWTNDSGNLNPTSSTTLYSFASLSQFVGNQTIVTPKATFTSEPWAMVAASFRPVRLGIEGTVTIGGYNYTNVTAAAPTTTLIKTGAGLLHSIVVNKPVATGVCELDDAITHTNPFATITTPSTATNPFSLTYDVQFNTGLTVYTSTAAQDITIVWK